MARADAPTIGDNSRSRFRLAAATMARGSLFLGAGLQTACVRRPEGEGLRSIEGPYRAKVLGNGLRELDRFLSVLIDEIAAVTIAGDDDRDRLTRQRNTPNKLRAIRASMGLGSPDHDRLRAIGRSRDCLFHCGGVVRRDDTRNDSGMVPGWPLGRHSPALSKGQMLTITPADLDHVCRLYDRLAMELVAACEAHLRLH